MTGNKHGFVCVCDKQPMDALLVNGYVVIITRHTTAINLMKPECVISSYFILCSFLFHLFFIYHRILTLLLCFLFFRGLFRSITTLLSLGIWPFVQTHMNERINRHVSYAHNDTSGWAYREHRDNQSFYCLHNIMSLLSYQTSRFLLPNNFEHTSPPVR